MNRFPQKIELKFNLLMNLNHLLKPPIILAGYMLYRKKSMPRKKIIKLSLIACRERRHWLKQLADLYSNKLGDPAKAVFQRGYYHTHIPILL